MSPHPSSSMESSFGCWLRTGRWKTASGPSQTEVKFNPWHDFRTGQFTYSHSGRYVGPGSHHAQPNPVPRTAYGHFLRTGFHGQGGRFGGGGATGSFPAPAPRHSEHPATRGQAHRQQSAAAAQALATPASNKPPPPKPAQRPAPSSHPAPAPVQTHIENGHRFEVHQNRTLRVLARPKLAAQSAPRSKKEQLRAGGADRKPTDDGGHFIAPRFGGPPKAFNHFAQDPSINRGLYRAMEDKWAAALKQGKPVYVEIIPKYTGQSSRPDWLHVWERIGEIITQKIIPNMRQKPNGK